MSIFEIIIRIVEALLLVCVAFILDSAFVLWLIKSFWQPKEEQKTEDLKQKADDNVKKQDNIRSLLIIANHSSEKTAKRLHHILKSAEYLEEHGTDMDRLHSYYLPEMVSILQRCQMLKKDGLIDKKTVKDMEDRTISAVTKVVDDMMADAVKKEMSGLKTDI